MAHPSSTCKLCCKMDRKYSDSAKKKKSQQSKSKRLRGKSRMAAYMPQNEMLIRDERDIPESSKATKSNSPLKSPTTVS